MAIARWLMVLMVFVLANASAQTPVEAHGALRVENGTILNQHDRPASLAGVSLFWSNTGWGAEGFYRESSVDYLAADWNASIVRAAMGVHAPGGYLDDPQGNQQRVETVVDAAIDAGLYVIIDWHSHEAEKNEAEAVAFFETMASRYGDHPNVLYEVYNEPIAQDWSTVIKPYAQNVANAIRAIDPDNLILVGSSTWSQDVNIAAADPLDGTNIAYTAHFYAGTHGAFLREKIQQALDLGAAVVISEWGTVNANGDGDVAESSTRQWMEFIEERNLIHLNWSLHNKDEGASIFQPETDPEGQWTDADLTDTGQFVKDLVRTWQKGDFTLNPGLSGAWYNVEIGGQGWLLDVFHQNGMAQLFLGWFTFALASDDAAGKGIGRPEHRWFTASGDVTGNTADLTIYESSNGIFNTAAVPETDPVGSMRITFDNCTEATLEFAFDTPEVPGDVVAIRRLSPDGLCRSERAKGG